MQSKLRSWFTKAKDKFENYPGPITLIALVLISGVIWFAFIRTPNSESVSSSGSAEKQLYTPPIQPRESGESGWSEAARTNPHWRNLSSKEKAAAAVVIEGRRGYAPAVIRVLDDMMSREPGTTGQIYYKPNTEPSVFEINNMRQKREEAAQQRNK